MSDLKEIPLSEYLPRISVLGRHTKLDPGLKKLYRNLKEKKKHKKYIKQLMLQIKRADVKRIVRELWVEKNISYTSNNP